MVRNYIISYAYYSKIYCCARFKNTGCSAKKIPQSESVPQKKTPQSESVPQKNHPRSRVVFLRNFSGHGRKPKPEEFTTFRKKNAPDFNMARFGHECA